MHVGDIAEYINGVAFKPSDWQDEGVPIIRIQNLTDESKPLNRTKRKVDTRFRIEKGDILFSWSATIDAFIWQREGAWLNQHIFKVLPDERIVSKEFTYYLLGLVARQLLSSGHLHGSTMRHVNRGPFLAHQVYIPPLDEQRRIVEIIEEEFSRLDAGENLLRTADVRAAKLVDAAYHKISSSCWPSVKLSDIAQTCSGGTPSRRRREYFGGNIPWVKSGELGDSRVLHTAETITELGLSSSSAKLLRKGTLMMAMYGATVGKLGILDLESAATNQAVCAIMPTDPEMTQFLWCFLRGIRRDLIASAKGGAQPNISQGMIRELRIPLPPANERTRLLVEIDKEVEGAQRLRIAAANGRVAAIRLRRSLLEKAFQGKLLGSWGNLSTVKLDEGVVVDDLIGTSTLPREDIV